MSVFRVRFRIAGGHVHCRLFVAPRANSTFAKAGDFTLSKGAEFKDFCLMMSESVELVGETELDTQYEAFTP